MDIDKYTLYHITDVSKDSVYFRKSNRTVIYASDLDSLAKKDFDTTMNSISRSKLIEITKSGEVIDDDQKP